MTTVAIKHSQTVVDTNYRLSLASAADTGSLATVLDTVFKADHTINQNYQYFSYYTFANSILRVSFSDGASKTYSGVALSNPGAYSGTAKVSQYDFYKSGWLSEAVAGSLTYSYNTDSNGYLSYAFTNGTVTSYLLTTLLSSTNSAYNQDLGNVTLSLKGNIAISSDASLSGTITSVSTTAQKFITSVTAQGNFSVSGNALSIASGLSHSVVSGDMTSYTEQYRDGSYTKFSGGSISLATTQQIDEKLLGDAAQFAGNDVLDIELPASIYENWLIASGAGADTIKIKGGGAKLSVQAGDGNDVVTLGDLGHSVDGGSGIDVAVYANNQSSYTLSKTTIGYTVKGSAGTGGSDTLANFERLQFADKKLALDLSSTGNAGKALEFIGTLSYSKINDTSLIGAVLSYIDQGISLHDLFQLVLDAGVVRQLAGSDSDTDLAKLVYRNVVGVEATTDTAAVLASYLQGSGGSLSKADFLTIVAGLEPNQAHINLVGLAQGGVEYQ